MKYRGVRSINGKWIAQLSVFGNQEYLGCFDSPEEAAREYDSMVMELLGDHSRLNFPNEHEEPKEVICKICKKFRCVNEFKFKTKKDGRKKYDLNCSSCLTEKRSKINQSYLENNNCSRATTYKKEVTYRKEIDYFKFIFYRIKHRCKKNNLEINIDSDFLKRLYNKQKGICALTGRSMTLTVGEGVVLDNASVDRIIPSDGYLRNNVQLVCFNANRARNNLSIAEFVNLCKQVVEHNG